MCWGIEKKKQLLLWNEIKIVILDDKEDASANIYETREYRERGDEENKK